MSNIAYILDQRRRFDEVLYQYAEACYRKTDPPAEYRSDQVVNAIFPVDRRREIVSITGTEYFSMLRKDENSVVVVTVSIETGEPIEQRIFMKLK